MEEEKCTRSIVGVLIWQNNAEKLLLLQGRKHPFWFAPPSFHVDRDKVSDYDIIQLINQKVKDLTNLTPGAEATKLTWANSLPGPCSLGGDRHHYAVYNSYLRENQTVKRDPAVVKSIQWVSIDELAKLAEDTKNYISGGRSRPVWEEPPGLEPVWVRLLAETSWLQKI